MADCPHLGATDTAGVDGGIHTGNIAQIAAAGATILVAGPAVFNNKASVAENIQQLRSHLPG